MRRKLRQNRRSDCPVGLALDIVGDRWTLLIARDLLITGKHGYAALLGSGERIATNVLADRLRTMQRHGLVYKVPHNLDGRKSEYHLTKRGLQLAPILAELILWGAECADAKVAPNFVERLRNNRRTTLDSLIAAAGKRAVRPS